MNETKSCIYLFILVLLLYATSYFKDILNKNFNIGCAIKNEGKKKSS